MSAPLIWVVLPLIAGMGFWLLRERPGRMILIAVGFCMALAAAAAFVPIGTPVSLGPLSFRIDPALAFAGRRLVLYQGDRPLLAFLYLICAFWFAGSYAVRSTRLLIPFGLGIVGMLVAALAVEPFLYAALLVETAVLLAVPLLAPPGGSLGQGVLRFVIFQTLAMPFILLAGWALAGVEANPSNETLLLLATVFLGLGFAFWLAIFPFYTWIPLLSAQTFPYVAGFVFLVFPTTNIMLGLSFLDSFGWLRSLPGLFTVIGQVGALMVFTSGVWASFQKDLARLFGYAIMDLEQLAKRLDWLDEERRKDKLSFKRWKSAWLEWKGMCLGFCSR
jgi:NADH-quinone oxidoreductase subunit N